MKKIEQITSRIGAKCLMMLLTAGLLIALPNKGFSQNVSISVNIPAWAPTYDYTDKVEYYYIPDIQCYYDVFTGEYIYYNGGMWVRSRFLPPTYSSYDLYNGFVVVLDYNVHNPWYRHSYYEGHYPRYYYRDRYHPNDNTPNNAYYGARGFSENQKKVVYSKNAPSGNNAGKNVNTSGSAMQKAPTPQQAAGRQQPTMQKAPTPQQAAGRQQPTMQKAPTPQQAAGRQQPTMQKAPTPQQAAGRQQPTMQKAPTPQQAAGRQQQPTMQKAPTPQQAARQQPTPAPQQRQAPQQMERQPAPQQRQAPQQMERQPAPQQQRQAPEQHAPAPAPRQGGAPAGGGGGQQPQGGGGGNRPH